VRLNIQSHWNNCCVWQCLTKAKKFQSKFYRWFERDILWGQLGHQPTDEEVDQVVAQAHTTLYDKDKAEGWIRKIQEWVPHFESKICRKFVTNAKTPEFPMKFNECLRRVIGGRSVGDCLHFFRKYWCAMLKIYADLGSEPAYGDDNKTDEGRQQMADKMVEKFTRDGVDEHWFNSIAQGFQMWRKENRIQQRRDAAKKRWQKEKSIDRGKKAGK
jgi:hypothetical protein